MELDAQPADKTPATFFAPHFTVDDEHWVVWDAVWEQADDGTLIEQLGYLYRHARTDLPLRVVWWRAEEEFELDYFPEPQKIRAMDAPLDEVVPETVRSHCVPLASVYCVELLLQQIDRDYITAVLFEDRATDAVEVIEVEGEQTEEVDGEREQFEMELDGERRQFAYELFIRALRHEHFVEQRKILRARRGGGVK